MFIKVLGASGYTRWKSQFARKFTSCWFKIDNRTFQIDVGNPPEREIDYLIISHTHYDHFQHIGKVRPGTVVLLPDKSFFEPMEKKNPSLMGVFIDGLWTYANFKIEPFKVLHSSTSETYGFKLFFGKKKVVWLTDYFIVPNLEVNLRKTDVLFLGASAMKKDILHRGYGHGQLCIWKMLQKISKLKDKPKKIYLIHFGSALRPLKIKIPYIQRNFPSLNIDWAWDDRLIQI